MFYLKFRALGSGQVRGGLFQARLGTWLVEVQHGLRPVELEDVGEHSGVGVGSGKQVGMGKKIWIFSDPAQSATQREVFSLEVSLTIRGKEERSSPKSS